METITVNNLLFEKIINIINYSVMINYKLSHQNTRLHSLSINFTEIPKVLQK
jgi:hypothetical protein